MKRKNVKLLRDITLLIPYLIFAGLYLTYLLIIKLKQNGKHELL